MVLSVAGYSMSTNVLNVPSKIGLLSPDIQYTDIISSELPLLPDTIITNDNQQFLIGFLHFLVVLDAVKETTEIEIIE